MWHPIPNGLSLRGAAHFTRSTLLPKTFSPPAKVGSCQEMDMVHQGSSTFIQPSISLYLCCLQDANVVTQFDLRIRS